MSEEESQQGAGTPGAEQAPAETPAAEPTSPQAPPKLNLDDLPEFRKWKSLTDRRLAESERKAAEAAAAAEQARTQLTEAQLRDAEPEQQITFYQSEMARLKAEQAREREAQETRNRYSERASQLLTSLGIDANHPELDWSGDPGPEGYATLAESAAKVARQQAATAAAQADKKEKEMARATQQTENQGAARVSVATGSGGKQDLQAEYDKRARALRGKGNVESALVQLKKEFRQKGLVI